jgi:hypothetical protein
MFAVLCAAGYVHEVPEAGEGPEEARGAWQLLETQAFKEY